MKTGECLRAAARLGLPGEAAPLAEMMNHWIDGFFSPTASPTWPISILPFCYCQPGDRGGPERLLWLWNCKKTATAVLLWHGFVQKRWNSNMQYLVTIFYSDFSWKSSQKFRVRESCGKETISHLQTSVSKFYFLFMFVPQCLVLYDLVRCDPQAVCKHCVHISTAVCSGQDVKFVVCAGRRRVCCGRDVD